MIALGAAILTRAMMGDDVYLVPRGNETLVGATVEEAGFDVTVTAEAVDCAARRARSRSARSSPGAEITRSWAGIRPATPDMLPILGPDPELPALDLRVRPLEERRPAHAGDGGRHRRAVSRSADTPTPIDALLDRAIFLTPKYDNLQASF